MVLNTGTLVIFYNISFLESYFDTELYIVDSVSLTLLNTLPNLMYHRMRNVFAIINGKALILANIILPWKPRFHTNKVALAKPFLF